MKNMRKMIFALYALVLLALTHTSLAAKDTQDSFASPEAAVGALIAAVRANDQAALRSILGQHGSTLTHSGDAVADEQSRARFIRSYEEASRIVPEGDRQAVLIVGKDEWPLPFPLVKSSTGWQFDTRQGEKEIIARRIGRNELATIQVCLAIVDAEREYAAQDRDGDGILEYTNRFISSEGKRDGLYWQSKAEVTQSPLGPLLAAAASEGYSGANNWSHAPYHGYYYRMLTRQGKDAPGGAYDYEMKGKRIGGFAVIAYPASYAVSGIKSFMINQDGTIYERDLGQDTTRIASKLTSFNPDAGWRRP